MNFDLFFDDIEYPEMGIVDLLLEIFKTRCKMKRPKNDLKSNILNLKAELELRDVSTTSKSKSTYDK